MDPLADQKRLEHARIAKFQKLWRSKRVFINSQGSWKVSPSALTAKIVTFKLPVNFHGVFDSTPKGFSEIMGYAGDFKKPIVRWVPGQGWIGDAEGVKKLVAKRGQQTIVLTNTYFDVMGLGNYEEALLAIVKNGWAPKMLLQAPPTYKKIDGIFYINRPIFLEDLKDELTKLPKSMVSEVRYLPELAVPACVLKLKNPKWTYQFFRNGTVLFTGIKDPSERDEPRKLFKEFFTKYDLIPLLAFNLSGSPAIKKPVKGNAAAKKAALANRNPLANSWTAKPPRGFYVRPGTNGKPRFYPWLRIEKKAYDVGEGMPHVNVKYFQMNLKGVGPKVAKAYAQVAVPIPPATRKIFANLGISLNEAQSPVSAPGLKNRRAPSWDATKPGFYVRPGPGKQPYWFAIPKGIASGRKTVLKAYADAGRAIPLAVRNIFKISNANVGDTNGQNLKHVITMGVNQILRINNRQATRLTKAELLKVARNMNIPQADAKMKPMNIIRLIQNKAGATKPIRNANVRVNDMFYRFLNNGRVEKTTNAGVQTRRAWATLPVAEQNKIAKALLPVNLHEEYNATAKANKFNTLRAYAASKVVPKVPSAPASGGGAGPAPSPSPSSAGSNNFNKELELALRLQGNLGNNYKNGNEGNFMKIYGKLPIGKRGEPLKANENKAYKKFVKETKVARANVEPRARYMGRIEVPNWMPKNKIQDYKNLVTNMAFQKPRPAQKDIRAAVRAWINETFPLSPPRPAKNVENMMTGEIKHIPAYVPKPRPSPVLPKRTPPAKKSPKKPKNNGIQKEWALPNNKTGIENLNNALTNLGLPTGPKNTYTWAGLEKAGLNKKFKAKWVAKVVKHT